jgi:hypothetical protein
MTVAVIGCFRQQFDVSDRCGSSRDVALARAGFH